MRTFASLFSPWEQVNIPCKLHAVLVVWCGGGGIIHNTWYTWKQEILIGIGNGDEDLKYAVNFRSGSWCLKNKVQNLKGCGLYSHL